MNDEPEIVMSELCRSIKFGDRSYRIEIYRGDLGWILEVVTEEDDSILWDDQFPTDKEALDQALKGIESGKIEEVTLYNAVPSTNLH